jgi:hypothetical protein
MIYSGCRPCHMRTHQVALQFQAPLFVPPDSSTSNTWFLVGPCHIYILESPKLHRSCTGYCDMFFYTDGFHKVGICRTRENKEVLGRSRFFFVDQLDSRFCYGHKDRRSFFKDLEDKDRSLHHDTFSRKCVCHNLILIHRFFHI